MAPDFRESTQTTIGLRLLAVAVSALCATACHRSPTTPSDAIAPETILVQGVARTYILHVPATYQSGSGAVVVA